MIFESGLNILNTEYSVGSRILVAFGNYDQAMLNRQCAVYGTDPSFGPTYLNISAMAKLKLKASGRLSLETAMAGFGLTFEGRQHRGVDDALQAVRFLWEVIK